MMRYIFLIVGLLIGLCFYAIIPDREHTATAEWKRIIISMALPLILLSIHLLMIFQQEGMHNLRLQ